MTGRNPMLCACCLALSLSCGAANEPRRLSAPEVAPGVWGVLAEPRGAGPHPGVVLLHGSAGWRPSYADLARALADEGFVALAVDYYAEAGPSAIGSEEKLRKWPRYQAAVRSAVDYVQALPSVAGHPVGLVGVSRGAFLAVSVASSMPEVGAVVDFYGGGGGGTDSLENEVRGLPPLLILHGEGDSVVPVTFAYRLRDAVTSAGGEVEVHVYPGAGHAFNVPHSPTYSEEAASDAFRRTVEFLRRRLRK